MERVADHCSNVAVSIIELDHGSFDTHEYLNSVKNGSNEAFTALYQKYLEKYTL
jgi:phosphate:Na+ symporter